MQGKRVAAVGKRNRAYISTEGLMLVYNKLKVTNLETARLLAETIEAKDYYTCGHCNRVRILSSSLAHHAGMEKQKIEVLEYGALLHDIGKIGIRETLLNKEGPLSADEMQSIGLHTIIGENILKTAGFFKACLKIIRNHHEWYNGSGYPDHYSGDQIEQSARIVSISDAFDAMTSSRPYRNALPLDFALEELVRGKGTQFDPQLVELFVAKELFAIERRTLLEKPA